MIRLACYHFLCSFLQTNERFDVSIVNLINCAKMVRLCCGCEKHFPVTGWKWACSVSFCVVVGVIVIFFHMGSEGSVLH